uniref:Calcium-binding protein n=1 Tax=Oryza sativa subsp. japonica TaxID=39947 RepID=Q8SAU4_ORYSJ|nr:Putative calcium-binding protein [Oryza sativa]
MASGKMENGQQQQQQEVRRRRNGEVVVDGSEILQLVENKEAFGKFVEQKFRLLDADGDGRLSVRELQPAVADIGAAIGLPARGSSAQADHIYSEVLNEFTKGKKESVSKSEFQRVLSDILLGMAAGLKRDPIVILRINGEDLNEFVESPRYEPEMAAIFSQVESGNSTLQQCMLAAIRQLTVDHGMPPASDSWSRKRNHFIQGNKYNRVTVILLPRLTKQSGDEVMENIIEPALQELHGDNLEQPVTQEVFFQEFRKFLAILTQRLQGHPVIVAHTENTFDGNGIKKLLSNKLELDKLLDCVWRGVPKEKDRTAKQYIRVAFDRMADSINLPPYGAVEQVDAVVDEAFKMAKAEDGKAVDETEFKKLLTEILGAVMLQLDGNPISVSTNSVLHEPMSTSSTLLSPSPPSPMVSSPSE